MIKRMRRFWKALFHEKLNLEERISRIVLLFAFIGSIIGMGRVACGVTPVVLSALVPMCIVAAAALYLAADGQTKRASWLLVLTYNIILFPLVFVMSGGVDSGTPVWLVLGLVYIFVLFKGRDVPIAMGISLVSFLLTYVVSYLHPQILVTASREYSYLDSYVTLLVVSCFVGLLMRIQFVTYDKERRLAEQQKEEIEQIARSKDAFFANMSHEIRTPINTIIGLNEMILREDISDEIAENAINIQNAGKMLLTTINDILDLSKLESGKMEIVPARYEISAMFSDLVNLIWIRAHQKELEFKVDIDPEIPSMLYGDEVRIKQIVTNFLTNAVKYTAKGSVTLTAKAERTAPDEILLRISVSDTGMGIRKEDLNNLFSSFKRVDERENRNIEGTGLGLNIAKQLAEMMGGKLSVDSVYHQGSVFTLEVRQRIVNVRPIGAISFAAQKQLDYRSKYKQSFTAPDAVILVVDDNEMNRMVAVKLLRGTGMTVETAQSGRECLRKTAEKLYHVILMDHMMPDMDGEETMRAVRTQARGYCQKTPIIALTANVMTNAEQVYHDMGFDGYLAKPINSALLEASILKYLPPELVEYTAGEEQDDGGEENAVRQVSGVRKRKIAVTADCICDLPRELLERYQIKLMYCYVHTKEGRFCDLSEVSSDSILEYLKTEGNYAHSSTAEPEKYEYFFSDALQEAEHVLHITATVALSGAYPNALQASRSFDNVTVFDSSHISSGHGLMVLRAAELAEQGRSVEEICRDLEEFREFVCSNFLVPSTDALYRNGKVGGAVHRLCRGLNLHPVLHMAQNELKLWKIETGNIRRARKRYVKALMEHGRIDRRILFLTYAGCTARQLEEIQEEVEKYAHFEKVVLQKASATVSGNCGMGVFGLMYIRKKNETAWW